MRKQIYLILAILEFILLIINLGVRFEIDNFFYRAAGKFVFPFEFHIYVLPFLNDHLLKISM